MFNKFIVIKDKKDILSKIYDKITNLNELLVLEEKPDLDIDLSSKNTVKLLSYLPNKIQLETSSTGNSLLFISDNYYPEWRVKIDGATSKLLIADYSFRAVAVPKGEHKIEFEYYPEKF